MTILPSGGKDQTIPPSETQLQFLEKETGLNCSQLNCTRRQASYWLGLLWSSSERKINREKAVSEILRNGGRIV